MTRAPMLINPAFLGLILTALSIGDSPDTVTLVDTDLPVSRKYKESVQRILN